ncbi:oligopeptide transporter subunit; ATP-binding component of ABC superfamily [Pseudodesulfovibrio profundus]|uniref:Oligopeptide transporter subunit ATP-binding component of ABC superfamily n=1 Tax=Pseudodesulfovibrio profundus TaxID=57320 RepID=A0A2C8F8B3_9BACT|nr:ABC transporter ATP-binding protein [Pseudodesulfovibrio profundus]SOB58794.1 oligopeptide transporter subunit; ATP-binding component of ABC superfamily [Pseudodesulfovibrio profundus]
MSQPAVIHLERMSKTFESGFFFKRRNVAVRDVTFSIAPGRTLAVVGESGCGKTTLARMAAGLLKPDSGLVSFAGRPLPTWDDRSLRQRLQMVFQDADGSLNPNFKARDLLLEPLRLHGLLHGDAEAQLERLLSMVGLVPDLLDRYPHEMSGGQRQRIGIARAMSLAPDLVIADEPVSSLDRSIQAQILSLLRSFQERDNVAYMYISHDLESVRAIAHDVAVMLGGVFVETGPVDEIFTNPMHPYTRLLFEDAIESCDARAASDYDMEWCQASVDGCAFAPLCPHAVAACSSSLPVLIEPTPGRYVRCALAADTNEIAA